MLSMLLLGAWLGMMHPKQWQAARSQHTQQVLAQAKQALLAYATQTLGATQCQLNCPRPGDLPCPDMNNDGVAENSCSSASSRLGRLPWRTLGTGDLRDASGERLWYALSNRYKNNPRLLPLNVDSPGEITLRLMGTTTYDASQGQGVVALMIAPMSVILREDGLQQTRGAEQDNQANAFLDSWQGEDNAQFVDASQNGFISAPASAQFNDALLPITASEMHVVMQSLVLAQIKQAILACGQACATVGWLRPASVQDSTCLGATSLASNACQASQDGMGRMPLSTALAQANSAVAWLFEGSAQHRWFQQNAWRELVLAQVRPQSVTITVAGEASKGQVRNTTQQKTQLNQYVSDPEGKLSVSKGKDIQWTYALK
jgi:hypothetical protein